MPKSIGRCGRTGAGTTQQNIGGALGWGRYVARADSLAGSIVRLRFHLDSDTTVQFGGVAIDDVSVTAYTHVPVVTAGQSFAPYLTGVTALSVAMAWLWSRTRGSLLLVMLMHAAINNTAGLVRSAVPDATHPLAPADAPSAWLTAAVLWVGAAYFLTRMRGTAADRLPPVVMTDP